jgi:hypothetical protein
MSDGTCGWNSGGKACLIQHATDNGCTVPSTFPTATVGSKKYVCYDFEGCKAGYPELELEHRAFACHHL